MIKKVILIFSLFTSLIYAEEVLPEWKKAFQNLSLEERRFLEAFFHTMLAESEGGYVLTGSKPVCMEGILSDERLDIRQVGTLPHKKSVYLRQGYQVWSNYFANIPNNNLMICCKDHEDSINSNWIHLLWINPQKLLEVVQANITLFQYVLGPEITPNAFLNSLSDPLQDVPHDYTLTGIFLGFGTQNALYYRRLELIEQQMYSREHPPYHAKNEMLNTSDLGYLGFDQVRAFETEPSFSYASLHEEYKSLGMMGTSSVKEAPAKFKIPLFAIYMNDSETKRILAHYQQDQKEIEVLLGKPNFLELVLQRIFE